MTTTLSDEEFRRLNEQLCELKNQNYQCDVNLRKALQDNQTLRAEIDQLRRQRRTSSSSASTPSTTTTTTTTNESTEKLKKLNPFTFAKNVAAKVDQRLHQFSLSSTNDNHHRHHQNHDDYQSNQSVDIAIIEQNYQVKINELETKIQQLEMKNSELSNIDTNRNKFISIIKELIERYVQESRQRQSQICTLTDSFCAESDFEPIVNGKIEQELIDSISNLDDFQLIFVKFIQHFEQKQIIFENVFDKIHKKQQELTNVIQSNDSCNDISENNEIEECVEKYENLIKERDTDIEKLNQQYQILEKTLTEFETIKVESEKQIKTLENRIVECEEDKKINEKRSLKYIKELRKLVNSEKNRADKLQNILNQETINTNTNVDHQNNKTANEWTINNNNNNNSGAASDRCSSTGSWTYMNDQSSSSSAIVPSKIDPEFSDLEICDINNKNMDDIQQSSKQQQQQQQQSSSKNRKFSNGMAKERYLESENNKLLETIVTLHQEKWSLEERVNILERELQQCLQNLANGNGSPNEITTSNIQTRQQTSPTSSNNSILKMINFIRDKSADTQQNSKQQINDVHRKLQRMVEEILTKNMHLQANLEDMSRELESTKDRLRRYEEPTTSSKA
nr:putative leucine-rich repeat-containing protein DDB_G0290503 [Dermatophagoides farinae]